MSRVRFTKDGYRFVITENNVRVYKRTYEGGCESETAISPQLAGRMKKKYAANINEAIFCNK